MVFCFLIFFCKLFSLFFIYVCLFLLLFFCFFFFFQAEDGIRDWSVTGVQTCALPISAGGDRAVAGAHRGAEARGGAPAEVLLGVVRDAGHGLHRVHGEPSRRGLRGQRSEERRVGKEWRCGGAWMD